MAVKTYSPKKVSVVIGGFIISGYAEGSFVKVEYEDDAFTKVTGADGETSRTHSANISGTITLTLLQTSESNDVLSGLHIADRLSLQGVVPVLIKDNNGTTFAGAPEAWIKKMPESEFAKEMGEREWVIDCGALLYTTGGNS